MIELQEAGSSGSVTFTYDAAQRLVTETIDRSPSGATVLTYSYDASGRVARILRRVE